MTAASIVDPRVPCPAAVHAVTAAAPRGGATKSALLAQFAEYGRIEADTHQGVTTDGLSGLARFRHARRERGRTSAVKRRPRACRRVRLWRGPGHRPPGRAPGPSRPPLFAQQRPKGVLRAVSPCRERALRGGQLRAGRIELRPLAARASGLYPDRGRCSWKGPVGSWVTFYHHEHFIAILPPHSGGILVTDQPSVK